MIRKLTYYIVLIIITTTFLGCTKTDAKDDNSEEVILQKISAEEAKEMMDSNTEYILLDVRTEEEFQSGHIEGARLLPDYEVEEKVETVLTDKAIPVLIYCRSGRRSAGAAQTLSDLGYTKVYDFGGIIDWPYEVVTEE